MQLSTVLLYSFGVATTLFSLTKADCIAPGRSSISFLRRLRWVLIQT